MNGGQANNNAAESGAAYAFDLDLDAWTDLGFGLAGAAGVPTLVGSGSLQSGSLVGLTLSGGEAQAFAYLVTGLSLFGAPFKGGVLVPHPDFVSPALITDVTGAIAAGGTWPAGVPSGFVTYFQWWIQDAAGPKGFAVSTAMSGTTP